MSKPEKRTSGQAELLGSVAVDGLLRTAAEARPPKPDEATTTERPPSK